MLGKKKGIESFSEQELQKELDRRKHEREKTKRWKVKVRGIYWNYYNLAPTEVFIDTEFVCKETEIEDIIKSIFSKKAKYEIEEIQDGE